MTMLFACSGGAYWRLISDRSAMPTVGYDDDEPPIICWELVSTSGHQFLIAGIEAENGVFFLSSPRGEREGMNLAELGADLFRQSGADDWSADSTPGLLDLQPATLAALLVDYPLLHCPETIALAAAANH